MENARGGHVTVSKGSNGAEAALDKVSLKAHAAVDASATMAHEAVDKAAGAAAPAADWLAEQGKSLQATQTKLVGDTCKYISGNPLKAVGVAVVAGFLLSRLILK